MKQLATGYGGAICAAFQERLTRFKENFCTHVAMAIWGKIDST
jgi:hypothetical protein